MGAAFKATVSKQLLTAGQVERQLAIAQGNYHNGVPAITVVVDAGWSKRNHKHSYNANSGVKVIFGTATKALLFISVRNKYCSICAINTRNEKPIPNHHCNRNWSGSSCSMEAEIILKGFWQSEEMHGLWYLWLIGDGNGCFRQLCWWEWWIDWYITVWLLVYHHMDVTSPKLSVLTTQ